MGRCATSFDHTPRLIVWSPTHGSGKSTVAEIIGRLAANVESISSLTGSELKAFMRGEAEKRNDPLIQKAYKENGLLGLGLHTYILDEAEQYKYTGLLMRLMNAGHRHDGQAWDGKGGKISVYAPMAIFRRFDPRHEPGLAPTVSRSVLVTDGEEETRKIPITSGSHCAPAILMCDGCRCSSSRSSVLLQG